MDGIGRRITYWRTVAGLSQSALARACRVSPGAVWQWENESATPSLKMIAKIARACGVELRIFFSDLPDDEAGGSSEPGGGGGRSAGAQE